MLKELEKLHKLGYIKGQKHPTLPLTIWNYTINVQYNNLWDLHPLIPQCRGLVTDDNTGEIVARPFKKFFNIEEQKHKATKDFTVYEKLDGSLIIMFFYEGQWRVASRGSFISDQAEKAIEILYESINEVLANPLDEDYTFMFEVIYPENRIVVDYGNSERLVMLGAIRTSDGYEMSYNELMEVLRGDSDYWNWELWFNWLSDYVGDRQDEHSGFDEETYMEGWIEGIEAFWESIKGEL